MMLENRFALIDPATTSIIRQLEERLLQPEFRKSPAEVRALLADDFVEFGVSGRVYDKAAVIEVLRQETPARLTISDFRMTLLAQGAVLVTYHAERHIQPGKPPIPSLRSSLWVWRDERWQMIFHQGTLQFG
jgi:hypothetical protein